ncbi:C-terminal autoproteolytic domain of nucleoporin nup98, partial [Ramicandelaber brevisporus]
YYMSPSPDEIENMTQAQLRKVNLRIGRQGHGLVEFLQPIDLTAFGGRCSDIPGNLVIFEKNSIMVYPDEDTAPPVGQGLNVPARITLLNCWPKNKATGEYIKDEDHPQMQRHVNKLMAKTDMDFVAYEHRDGAWTFEVQH